MAGHTWGTDTELGQVAGSEALDHLAWVTYHRRQSHGVRLAVRATSPAHRDEVEGVLPPGQPDEGGDDAHITYSVVWGEDRTGTDHEHSLFLDQRCLYRGSSREELVSALQSDATWRVATQSFEGMFIHAGAAACAGIGLVLPGSSGAGKSTLVRQLLSLGAEYYSDEYAVIDEGGRLRPFPCLIRVKESPRGVRRVRPGELKARIGQEPRDIGLVAFPAFTAHSALRMEPLTRSQASLHLLQHMPAARLTPERSLEAASAATKNAACLRLQYGDSAQAASALIGLLRGDSSNHP